MKKVRHKKMKETHKRSIAKGISYRIIATFITTVLVFALTGNLIVSFSVGFLELISKTFLYYFHERLWNKIAWEIK